MKFYVNLFLALLFATNIIAQDNPPLEPTKWSTSIHKTKIAGEYILRFEVNIENGWNIFISMDDPANGPLPVSFSFGDLDNVELIGTTTCKTKPEKVYDNTFLMNVESISKKGIWEQRVRLTKLKNTAKVEGYIQFMSGDKNRLLPPYDQCFQFKINQKHPTLKIGAGDCIKSEIKD